VSTVEESGLTRPAAACSCHGSLSTAAFAHRSVVADTADRKQSAVAQSQVNVRIDSRKLEILEAAAFVDGRSMGDLVRGAVEDLADHLYEQAAVQLAIQARDEHAGKPKSNLAGFPTKHRGTRAADA